ncbi:hypothetical protein BCR32DRAFT_276674 [Anaeromyces robustus]|uniref:Alcohol acetyltransferase n=1 Tax=Anaeromyces robustus TaxID=1754192 RepID=A0A1Y1XGP3_9FUNG|nr:hypothetical protein BCR32DRAFT_276674 [Anaeromyces robustus]|eukprot:ORX84930.1 hypothetical protein BCR32DRAFT_276674 [Anaeromyces robustus]
MFEEFKKIDHRIIRPINGNEFFITSSLLNLTDFFPKFSIEDFKKRAQENLSKIKVFNYALKKINNYYFWIEKPFKIHIQEIPWKEEEELDHYLKSENKIILPFDPINDEEEKDVLLLYNFKICQLQKSNQTKLTFSALHPVCDGRTIFYMFDLIRKIINGETLEPDHESLPSFDLKEIFTNLENPSILEDGNPPEPWNQIKPLNILPKIELPIQYITLHYLFDYPPIEKFCLENNITIQCMLMAMLTRATRRYKNLSKETALWVGTPFDTRSSKYASEEHKNKKFYCNTSFIFPCVQGQNSLLEDLKHCAQQLSEAKNTKDYIKHIMFGSTIIDPKTLEFKPKGMFPSGHHQAIVNGSNIGKINGNKPLFQLVSLTPFPDAYSHVYHSYYTEETLFICSQMPFNIDKLYIDLIKEEMDKIFIPENIPKY